MLVVLSSTHFVLCLSESLDLTTVWQNGTRIIYFAVMENIWPKSIFEWWIYDSSNVLIIRVMKTSFWKVTCIWQISVVTAFLTASVLNLDPISYTLNFSLIYVCCCWYFCCRFCRFAFQYRRCFSKHIYKLSYFFDNYPGE